MEQSVMVKGMDLVCCPSNRTLMLMVPGSVNSEGGMLTFILVGEMQLGVSLRLFQQTTGSVQVIFTGDLQARD